MEKPDPRQMRLNFPDIPSWEDRLKARQEDLSGKPAEHCLFELPAKGWPRSGKHCQRIIAMMCLGMNPDCEACYKMLDNV